MFLAYWTTLRTNINYKSVVHGDLAETEGLDGFTCVSLDSFDLQFQIPYLLASFTEFSCKTSIFLSERSRL